MSDYAIIDNEGIIYSGNENEMREIWDKLDDGSPLYDENAVDEYFPDGWDGDIMLVEILGYIH